MLGIEEDEMQLLEEGFRILERSFSQTCLFSFSAFGTIEPHIAHPDIVERLWLGDGRVVVRI